MAARKERARSAPSPTGFLLVEGPRTAVFDWHFAGHDTFGVSELKWISSHNRRLAGAREIADEVSTFPRLNQPVLPDLSSDLKQVGIPVIVEGSGRKKAVELHKITRVPGD